MALQVYLDLKDLWDPKEQRGWLDLKEIPVLVAWPVPLDLLVNSLLFHLRFFSKKMSLLAANVKSVETRVPVLDPNRTRMWI